MAPRRRRQQETTFALVRRLWRDYLRAHSAWIALAFGLMVIEGSTLGLLSYALKPMFDRVFVGGETDMMWIVGTGILMLFVIRAVTGIASRMITTRISQTSATEMQIDLLRHLMALDTQFFQKNPPGSLMERVVGDTGGVQGLWRTIVGGVGRDMIALVSLFVVAVAIDPVWTLLALVAAPALILPTLALQRYIRRKSRQMRLQSGRRMIRLSEIFQGINPVKLNLMEGYQLGQFEAIVQNLVRNQIKMAGMKGLLPGLIDLVTGVGFFFVLIVGGRDIIAGEKTVGDFMSFFTAMALAFQPLRRLGTTAGVFQVAAANLERLYELFDEKPTIVSPPSPAKVPVGQTEIELGGVHFAYGDLPVLHGASFVAEAGKTTALVGPSGAGKSTVFNVLTRLADPQFGNVTIGGVDTRELSLEDVRGLVSVVTQDALLFDETIRENILLGRTDVDEARLREVVEAAHVADFLDQLPQGLATPVGPRGSSLSGGQRQRVAIARALLRDTPILLLDEATSALDAASEAVVQAALERLSEGRTTLVIAHRLATVRDADKIVVMQGGHVVEEGRHEDLITRGGLYARLYELQFSETTT
ncbi:ABC transporter ATP-binding protein [Roseitranquillus sediminis]|uniref:ABC transporter ATP-binding protein n=1 Tax=Roseitranquillus sediminis TaxID=2809051 RepID=UPI001D0C3E34|nr:ABC transporter ATP-binding protein [Roseitranquillus sediminis]MBM9595809.1 ABC transporter ATP-binding protein [Roseitranquillus sediminis]